MVAMENFNPQDSRYPSAPQQGNGPTAGWGSPEQTQETTAQFPSGQGPAEGLSQGRPQAGHERARRVVGAGAATTMCLVAALVGGGVTGVVVSQTSGQQQTAVSALDKEPTSADSGTGSGEGQGGTTGETTGVERVADAVLPSVVSIQVATARGGGEGSGSIISSDGLVLTNAHVAAPAAEPGAQMQVTLNDGQTHPAELVAADTATDIAVVKIQGVDGLPVMEFGDSSQLKVGQPVVAVGSPLGLSSTVTSGIVSALNRPVRASAEGGESTLIDAVQTDAAINPGNSGGPLVDMDGRLIGMNSVIASLSAGGSSEQSGSIGLGFAIPSNFAQRVAKQLVDTGEAEQPMLGLQVRADDRVQGAVVAAVPDGPAKDAGIEEGDIITQVNDRHVDSADALIAAVRTHDFGETVTLQVRSADERETHPVEVTLTSE